MVASIIVGCAGEILSADERDFFRDLNPLGLILFARNCKDADQIRHLIDDFRDLFGRDFVPVLIDQEGGRVARLQPPLAYKTPPMRVFGEIVDKMDMNVAERAVYLNSRIQAADLRALGITVNCAPVVDLYYDWAHDVIGDRAFSHDPEIVARLGHHACMGYLHGGITPVIKHIPGHGRAQVDSHFDLPLVDAPLDELDDSDFYPFRVLSEQGILHDKFWAMVAHVTYRKAGKKPATLCPDVVETLLRGRLKCQAPMIADDVSMQALEEQVAGDIGDRAKATLQAGLDLTLHCNGKMEELKQLLNKVQPLSDKAYERLKLAEEGRIALKMEDNQEEQVQELNKILRHAGLDIEITR